MPKKGLRYLCLLLASMPCGVALGLGWWGFGLGWGPRFGHRSQTLDERCPHTLSFSSVHSLVYLLEQRLCVWGLNVVKPCHEQHPCEAQRAVPAVSGARGSNR